MFSVIRPGTCTIADINLGAYLLFRGAKLEGVEFIKENRSAFTFSHKHLSDYINEYHQGLEVHFSPKILFTFRDDLKRLANIPTKA